MSVGPSGFGYMGGDEQWCRKWTRECFLDSGSGSCARQFSRARVAAHLSGKLTPQLISFITAFYTGSTEWQSSSVLGWKSTDPAINSAGLAVYLPIWKSGSQMIQSAMQDSARRLDGKKGLRVQSNGGVLASDTTPVKDGQRTVAAISNIERVIGANVTYFTFVREPLAHLISGFHQSVGMTHSSCCSPHPAPACSECGLDNDACSMEYAGSIDAARAFWMAMLNGERGALKAMLLCLDDFHFASQLHGLSVMPRLDFVGRLETFTSSWNRLSHKTGGVILPHKQLNSTLRQQSFRTARTPYVELRVRRLKQVLALDNHIRSAIREILTPEYRCLGYEPA